MCKGGESRILETSIHIVGKSRYGRYFFVVAQRSDDGAEWTELVATCAKEEVVYMGFNYNFNILDEKGWVTKEDGVGDTPAKVYNCLSGHVMAHKPSSAWYPFHQHSLRQKG